MENTQRNAQILGLILVAIAMKMCWDHYSPGYDGPYKSNGSYDKISAVRHDMAKTFTVEVMMMLFMGGLVSGEAFFSTKNFMGSWIGRTTASVASYYVFHQLIQPYVLTMVPTFRTQMA